MPGNQALNTNAVVGDHPDLAITDRGSDWYWTVCGLMAVSTFVFMGLSYTKKQTHRLFHYTTAGITLVASISYYSMASGLGQTAIQAQFVRPYLMDVAAAGTRQIFWVRYVDYAITTPLILTNLFLTSSIPRPTMLATLLADELMVVCYLAGALTQTGYKWGYFVFGLFAYFFVVYSLIFDGRRYASALGGAINKTFLTCAGMTIFFWFLYPIAWGISEGGNVIHPDSEAIFYGILDIFSKIVVGFLLVLGHKNIDPAELGLHIREHSILPRHEKHGGAHRDHNDYSDNDNHHKRGLGGLGGLGHRKGNTDHRNGVTDHRNMAMNHKNGVTGHRDRTPDHHNGVSNYHDRDTDDTHHRGVKTGRGGLMGLLRKGNRQNDTDNKHHTRDRSPVRREYDTRDRSPARGEYHSRNRSPGRGDHHSRNRSPLMGDHRSRNRSPGRGEHHYRNRSPLRDEYQTDRRGNNKTDYNARDHSPSRGEYRAGQRSPTRDGYRSDGHRQTGAVNFTDGRRSFPGGEHYGDGRRSFHGGEHHGDGRRSAPGDDYYRDGRRSGPGGEYHGDGRRSAPGGDYNRDGRRSSPGFEHQTTERRSFPDAESRGQNIRSVPGGDFSAENRRAVPGNEGHGHALRPDLGNESQGNIHRPIPGNEYQPDNRQSAGIFRSDNPHASGEFQEPQGSGILKPGPILGTEHT